MLGAMTIAGRAHCGRTADDRSWVPLAARGLLLAAAARATAGWLLPDPVAAWALAGVLWCLSFGLYAVHLAPVLVAARDDGRVGCQGQLDG